MLTSVDGRLFAHRWTPPTTKDAVGYAINFYWNAINDVYAADGWIAGGSTILDRNLKGKENPNPAKITPKKRKNYRVDRHGCQLAVSMDPHGKVHYGQDAIGGRHIVEVIGEHVTDEYLEELHHDGVSYIFAGKDGRDIEKVLVTLKKEFAVDHLVLQGGAVINAGFLKAGFIDEISLLIHPGIDGLASIPSIYAYYGDTKERPASGQALKLRSADALAHDVVWLRYDVVNSSKEVADLWQEKTPVTDIYDV